ncbi:hypothetical protein [Pragia fontium]|uniref:hypothetical protein n=1 Tax=Pragia fontium TaxID=82985 RepID=UPI00064AA860|nr:hypothetical protein [Pragia fontium]AKJ43426.1 hypothetical protein QQ39_16315 [Pragia fontium]
MKIKNKFTTIVLLLALFATVYMLWQNRMQERTFACIASVHSKLLADKCDRHSVFDVFLAMHGNGKGYWMISGTSACSNAPSKLLDGIIDFTYKKEGEYFSIHMDKRNSDIAEVFNALKYDDLKLKITKVNMWDYALSLTNQVLMVCTED